MQPPTNITNQCDQARLNKRMHVFRSGLDGQAFSAHRFQSGSDLFSFRSGQHSRTLKRRAVGKAGTHVGLKHSPIKPK
jgi:hypothetical protein